MIQTVHEKGTIIVDQKSGDHPFEGQTLLLYDAVPDLSYRQLSSITERSFPFTTWDKAASSLPPLKKPPSSEIETTSQDVLRRVKVVNLFTLSYN